MTGDIAIVGLAGRFPGAASIDQFWANVLAGRVTVSQLTRGELLGAGVAASQLDDPAYVPARGVLADPELFDADFFGITPREAAIMDPQHRLLLQTAWETLESGNLLTDQPAGRVGVFAGAGFNYYLLNHVLARPDVLATHGLLSIVLGNEKDHLAARIAYRLGLRGPAVTVQTACSTSLVAVHLACQSLHAGDSDIALAGGVCVAVPQQAGYLYEPRGITSRDGACRPFDADADGTVPGNGVAMVALKRAEDALRDGDTVYALVKGSAINNDGAAKVGYTAPGIEGQVDVLTRAYANAGVDPATVGYLEAHGTATEVGDAIELAALNQVFGRTGPPCSIGSVKANIGHLDAAAGVTGLIKAVLVLRSRRIPPLAGVKQVRRELVDGSTPFTVDTVDRHWAVGRGEIRHAAVSSFGLGGTNAHMVLAEALVPTATQAGTDEVVLPVSASTPQALREAAQRLTDWLRSRSDLNVADVAVTLQSHRRPFRHRLAVPARDIDEAVRKLTRAPRREALRRPKVVFLFPGQGAEFPGMVDEYYQRFPSFRADIDRGATQLRDLLGIDVRDVLVRDDPAGLVHRTDITQPALVLHEYALGRLLLSWGIRPAALVGHSVGEFAAACLAGEFGLADALRLVAERGRCMQQAAEGGMVVIMAGVDQVLGCLGDFADLDVAAVNAPNVTVVAGPPTPLADLTTRLTAAGVSTRVMPARRAFHSWMMADAAAELGRMAATVEHRPRTHDIVSSVDGRLLDRGQARTPGYWADQLRSPVRYQDAVVTAVTTLTNAVLVEVGPGAGLSGLASQIPQARHSTVVALQPQRAVRAGVRGLLTAVGSLWAAGIDVRWPSVRIGGDRVELPTYPFARTRHWLDIAAAPPPSDELVTSSARGDDVVLAEIIELWQSMLGVPAITGDDDFFQLGGESLLFIRMVTRVQRKFGVALSVADLTGTPTPLAIADQVLGHQAPERVQ